MEHQTEDPYVPTAIDELDVQIACLVYPGHGASLVRHRAQLLLIEEEEESVVEMATAVVWYVDIHEPKIWYFIDEIGGDLYFALGETVVFCDLRTCSALGTCDNIVFIESIEGEKVGDRLFSEFAELVLTVIGRDHTVVMAFAPNTPQEQTLLRTLGLEPFNDCLWSTGI